VQEVVLGPTSVSASSISRLGLFLDLGNGAGSSAASGDLLGAGSAAGSAVPSMTFAASPARAASTEDTKALPFSAHIQ